MATTAIRSEAAEMHVVCAMAIDANVRRFLFARTMTVGAVCARMRAIQRKLGLRSVIERPVRPGNRIMTIAACDAERAFVHVVFPMTIETRKRRVLVPLGRVASAALYVAMLADKRKARQIVVEDNRYLPAFIVMALLALSAQLIDMHIVIPVTGDTCGFDFRSGSADSVTIDALGWHVLASERKSRALRMIEPRNLPIAGVMTLLAVDTETTLVGIILLVARLAIDRNSDLGCGLDVTRLAPDIRMLSQQREFRLAVVELSDLPVLRGMASAAILA
jgi:hypothetical protein